MCGKNRVKKGIFIALVFILVACQSKLTATPILLPPTATAILPTPDIEAEEYEIYVVLLAATYSSDLTIVIRDHTSPGINGPGEELKKTLEYVKKQLPTMALDTLENFEAANRQEYPLIHTFAGYHCVLVSDKELNEVFSTEDGWDKFYTRYPHSQGEMTLSRVGFNHDMNQALLYVGNVSGMTEGAGFYVLLQKLNGVWYIKNKVNTWIS